jgi:hypothetical protein
LPSSPHIKNREKQMTAQGLYLVLGMGLLASWVMVIARKYHLAPVLLALAPVTYFIATFLGFLSNPSDPTRLATLVAKKCFQATVAFLIVVTTTILYLVTLLT